MKTATCTKKSFWNQPYVPYPNAATRRQVFNKVMDRLLMTASCMGVVTVVLFLLTLC